MNIPGSLFEKLQVLSPFSEEATHINAVLMPRFLVKTFKPISLYLYYKNTDFIGLIAEVQNTYQEAHYYAVQADNTGKRITIAKTFHVSPFFDETGDYSFNIINTPTLFEIHITYKQENRPVFYANFCGQKHALTRYCILKLAIAYPLSLALVYPRILWQAARLYYQKKLPARPKPPQDSANQLRPMPLSWVHRWVFRRIKALNRYPLTHSVRLVLPDKTELVLGTETDETPVVQIHNTWFFRSILLGGEIGFGESFMKGEWSSESPEKVLKFMILNLPHIIPKFKGAIIMRLLNTIRHNLRPNTLAGSRDNIRDHYDLSNAFYRLFLDKTMMYSSGLFKQPTDTLTQAQIQKVRRLCDGLSLKPGDSVLEIGSGWGYVALTLAQAYGCIVKTITLSKEQYDYTKARVAGQRVSVELQDYRSIPETACYDAVISIEMIEAVGHDYLPLFFQTCNRVLKPGGRLALQGIIYNKLDNYDQYRKRSDFIRRHIFPGGHLPSRAIINTSIAHYTTLSLVSELNIASSYAKTLHQWRDNLVQAQRKVRELGFDLLFFRKWCYYLAYCEVAFATDYLGCHQLIYEKKQERL